MPDSAFYHYKMIETAGMSAAKTCDNLKVYVIWPGVLYGQGEDVFYEYFRRAWLNDPQTLPLLGDGKNYLPAIHVKDFSNLVKRVLEDSPDQKYIFAVDQAKKRKLKDFVVAIASGVGTGKVENVDKLPDFLDRKEFKLNLKVKATKIFEDKPEEEVENEDEEEEKPKFDWHCKVFA